MTTKLDYGIFDCDTHCYEPRDAFTRYLPKEFHDRAITPVRAADGKEVILAGNRIATFNSEQGSASTSPTGPARSRRCSSRWRRATRTRPTSPSRCGPSISSANRGSESWSSRTSSVRLFPAGMALAAEHYVDDTEALYANLRSFNRWYDETWGFNYEDRLYATALLSLRDLDIAVAETEAIIEQGARVVLLPTGPAYGRSPGDPYFDPVWPRLNEAGCTVAFHIMPYWYFDAISPAWGHDPDPASWHMSAWQWKNVYGERPIEDTLSALIFDNLFGRFPDLNVLVAEHGAEWVPHFVRTWTRAAAWAATGRGSAASSPSVRRRSSAATSASSRTRRTTSRGSSQRLGHVDCRDGLGLPARRGPGRAGRLRQAARPARRRRQAADHARQRRSAASAGASGRWGPTMTNDVDLDLLRESARDFLAGRGEKDSVGDLAAMDWTGLLVDEDLSGVGWRPVETAVIAEELGRARELVARGFGCVTAAAALSTAPDEVRDRWLPAMLEGTASAAVALVRRCRAGRVSGDEIDILVTLGRNGIHLIEMANTLPRMLDDELAGRQPRRRGASTSPERRAC